LIFPEPGVRQMLHDPKWQNNTPAHALKSSFREKAMGSISRLAQSTVLAGQTPVATRFPTIAARPIQRLIAALGLSRFFRRQAAGMRRRIRRARTAISQNLKRRSDRAQQRRRQLLAQGGSSGLHALEPRMVFDAAAAITADAAADQVAEQQATDAQTAEPAAAADTATPADPDLIAAVDSIGTSSNRHEIAFVDSAVENVATLLSGIDPTVEIVMIDPNQDGVEQISAALEGREDLTAIHILSHGEQGRLFLGNDVLDAASMQGEHLDELTSIRNALTADGDILIYGCDFTGGDAGLEAAILLGSITGADIAASNDDTGNADLGGDWDLETEVGTIETASIEVEHYEGLLAPLSVTTVGTGGVTATTIAQQIVGNDVTIVSASLGGSAAQAGTFTSATGYSPSWLAFDTGVVFSSGTASSLTDSNAGDTSHTFQGGSAPAEFGVVGSGNAFDASYIDISFIPDNDKIAIQFVFGSDEYNEYVFASVNDAIGMWVNGTNIAVNPLGAPIGIDTINDAANYNPAFGSQNNDSNPGNGVYDSSAPSLYVNNDPSDGGPTYSTSMDGFTRTLGANISVNAGVVNTIRLGVSDIGDDFLDSWLLIRGDSFQSNLIAENDSVGTLIDTPVTFSPTANDTDFDNDTISIVNIADQPISPGNTVTLGSGGTILLNTDGTVTYTPPPGSTAPELFTYTATDSNGNTATAYVTVNIVTGSPPAIDLDNSAAGTGYATTFQTGGTAVPIADTDALVTDTDSSIAGATIGISNAFTGDQLTVGSLPSGISIDTANSTPTSIVLTGNATPAAYASAIQAIAYANGNATPDMTDRTIAVQLTDTQGLSSNLALATVTLVANTAPIAVDNAYTGAGEDSGPTVIGNALTDNDGGVDSDPDGDTLALVAASNVAGTNGGLFTVATNGTVTFDANGDFENLAVGETATTSYTYTLTDGEGGTDTATITVEVTGANDRPVIVDPVTGNPIPGVIDPTTGLPTDPVTGLPLEPIPAQTGNDADGPISIDVGALVADPDASDVSRLRRHRSAARPVNRPADRRDHRNHRSLRQPRRTVERRRLSRHRHGNRSARSCRHPDLHLHRVEPGPHRRRQHLHRCWRRQRPDRHRQCAHRQRRRRR
jgi:VCBS repeat-containing protein